MNQGLTGIFVFLFLSLCWAQKTSSNLVQIKFEDLPQLVQEKNENVKAAKSTHRAKSARTGYLTRSFLPQFSLKGGAESAKYGSESRVEKGFWSVEGKLNLFRGGRDLLEEDIREQEASIAQIRVLEEKQNELKEARKIYWEIVASQKNIQDIKDALITNDENIKSARRRSGAGVATNADAIQFELERTLLNQQLKKMTHEVDILKSHLATAISLDDHKNIEVSNDFPHPTDQLTPESSMNPKKDFLYTLLKQEEELNSLKQKQASRWWLPKLDLYTSYGIPQLSFDEARARAEDTEWFTGIMLTFDLEQALEDNSERKNQKWLKEASSYRAAHRIREATSFNHELIHDLNLLHELIHDADKDIERALSFVKLTKSEYNRGVKNGPDLLEAYAKYYEFRTRLSELYKAYHQTEADLQYQLSLQKEPM